MTPFNFNFNALRLWHIIAVVPFLGMSPTYARLHKGSQYCEGYDTIKCRNGTSCEPKIEKCEKDDMHCYASWFPANNATGKPHVVLKGCWENSDDCKGKKECVGKETLSNDVIFCCCEGLVCNKNFTYHYDTTSSKKIQEEEPMGVVHHMGEQKLSKTLLCSVVPISIGSLVIVILFFLWRRHRRHPGHTQLPTMDPSLAPTPSQTSLNVQLLELRAKGRYGFVWKAQLLEQSVAVKIFPLGDQKSWAAELEVYNLPRMKHDNILRFIAAEKKEEPSYTEFWLITEFHEHGSLCDFLKMNTISWAQLCRIGESMTCGLAYLHDEIVASSNYEAKSAVAHRDFKSKNVLIRADLTACIADFGLALIFQPQKGLNDTHTQVGTRRYMAPEVLDGAICFNRDSFLRIDMYACGLILWELMTRCTCQDGVVEEYRLPFEAEVGPQPSLEEMQTLVVADKCRPAIKATWQKHAGLSNMIATIEECWDQDAEARLSAGCVQERMSQFSRTINSGGFGCQGDSSQLLAPSIINPAPLPYVPNPSVIENGDIRMNNNAYLSREFNPC